MSDKKIFEKKHGHRYPVTRREFLANGLIAFGAGLVPWSFEWAWAQQTGQKTNIPILIFDLAGGASLPGNFLVGNKGGPEDFLSSYDTLGWEPKASGALDRTFGIPMSARYSKILEGLKATMSAGAQERFRMASFCHFAQSDSNTNPLSIAALAAQNFSGKPLFRKGLSSVYSRLSESAGSALTPPQVKRVQDITEAAKIPKTGPFSEISQEGLQGMLGASKDLAELQLSSQSSSVQKAYAENLNSLKATPKLDAREEAEFQRIYGINPSTAPTNENAIFASIMLNTLTLRSPCGIIQLGDCDYHDSTQTKGDTMDLKIGTTIGRAIESAHALKTPVFIQIITDGGNYASRGTRNWAGDDTQKCLSIAGFYDPKGAPNLRKQQVGYYLDSQGVEDKTVVGNPVKSAYAIFANYLSLCKRLEDLGNQVFTNRELDSVLVFG